MVPNQELSSYGVGHLLKEYDKREWPYLHMPVVDQKVCSVEELGILVGWIDSQVSQGLSVVVHCVGGLGRSGFAAAGFLVGRGMTPELAIQLVRECRSPRALETRIQEQLVEEFAKLRDSG